MKGVRAMVATTTGCFAGMMAPDGLLADACHSLDEFGADRRLKPGIEPRTAAHRRPS